MKRWEEEKGGQIKYTMQSLERWKIEDPDKTIKKFKSDKGIMEHQQKRQVEAKVQFTRTVSALSGKFQTERKR